MNLLGGMPLARLRLRHHTGGGVFIFKPVGERLIKPLAPQFPLAEPAYCLSSLGKLLHGSGSSVDFGSRHGDFTDVDVSP